MNKHTIKNIWSMDVYTNYYKKSIYFFSPLSIRMSGNSIKFDDKKNKKKWLLQKQKRYLI